MKENSFITIRNGAIASFVAGIALLIVPDIRGYLVSFLGWLWSGVTWCWDALFLSYAIPGWAWLIVIIFSVTGFLTLFFAIRKNLTTPEYSSYTEDYIKGAIWRWRWAYNKITDLWCFCPSCEAVLVYDDSSCRSLYSNACKTDFICENCNHSVITSISGGNKSYAVGAIEREIDRRIRTNEYKKH